MQLGFITFSFERQLQNGEYFVKNMNLARTGTSASVVYVHLRATIGPSPQAALLVLQAGSTGGQVTLNVPANAGAEVDKEFDALGGVVGATPMAALQFNVGGGLLLNCFVQLASGLEGPGSLILGVQYA